MSSRTVSTIVHFDKPFQLGASEAIYPAGDYKVDEDQELISELNSVAYRRTATYLNLPAISAVKTRMQQMLPINPNDLEQALRRDQSP